MEGRRLEAALLRRGQKKPPAIKRKTRRGAGSAKGTANVLGGGQKGTKLTWG